MTRDAWADLRPVILAAINGQPRSQQVRIGPSEIGTGCNACLVSKLAGLPKTEHAMPWLPWIGTAVHAQLDAAFAGDPRWLTETTVTVGTILGEPITGHADLYDTATGTVYDWKIVGKTTLDAARRGNVSRAYNVQRHLYGAGFEAAGYPVNEVGIVYLPRNHPSIDSLHIDLAPYDLNVAIVAMERADSWARHIRRVGIDAALKDTHGHTGAEYDCARYETERTS